MKTIETWFLWLMIYSIIGWVYESTICSIGHRKLINRGFLNGPYCPIYGTGAVLVLLVLRRSGRRRVGRSCWAGFRTRCCCFLPARW